MSLPSLNSKLARVASALTGITGLKVYHYWRSSTEYPYCIWQEDSESSSLQADDGKHEQAVQGTVDYFTRTEFDSVVDSIQSALNSVESLSWYLESVQFEEDNNLIHYSWTWVIG